MQRSIKTLTAVATFLSVAACASSPASLPVIVSPEIPSSAPALPDRFVKSVFRGVPGVWIAAEAYNDMLVGFALEKGDLRTALASALASQRIAEDESARTRADAKGLQWRATWGPVLAFLGGVVLTVAVLVGGLFAGRALAPYTSSQAPLTAPGF